MSEEQDLVDDLTVVAYLLQTYGWGRGALFHLRAGANDKHPNPEGCRNMCLTGAAGIAVDSSIFMQWVVENDSTSSLEYPWSERGRNVLRALAEQILKWLGRPGSPQMAPDGSVLPFEDWPAAAYISKIVEYNDQVLTRSAAGKLVAQALVAAGNRAREVADLPGVGLKKKVIRVQAPQDGQRAEAAEVTV